MNETVATGGQGTFPGCVLVLCLNCGMSHDSEPQHHEIITKGHIRWVMMESSASLALCR